MDPTTTLMDFWIAIELKSYKRAMEKRRILLDWLTKGGDEPEWSKTPYTKEEFLTYMVPKE